MNANRFFLIILSIHVKLFIKQYYLDRQDKTDVGLC